jgi:hypothetical protein
MGGKRARGQKFLVVLTVVLVLGIAASFAVSAAQERALAEGIARAKAAGFPFKAEDLKPARMPKPAENAALIYEKLDALRRSLVFTDQSAGQVALSKPWPDDPRTPEEWAAMELYVTEAEPLIEAFMRAAQLPSCYFDKDWDEGVGLLLPEYAAVKEAARTALGRAALRARRGEVSFLEDVAAVRRSARHMQAQPPLIALHVSFSLDSMGLTAIQQSLAHFSGDTKSLEAIRVEAAAFPEEWDVEVQLRCEAFFGWWCANHLDLVAQYMTGADYSHVGPPQVEPHVRFLAGTQTVARTVKRSILEIYTPALGSYEPGTDERKLFDGLDERGRRASESLVAGYFVGVIAPVFGRTPIAMDRLRAVRRCILAAVAVLEHRNARGAWPETLAAAGVDLLDPFDGKPLRFKAVGGGFRVWSVGDDLKDDGGLTRKEGQGSYDEVLVFDPAGVPK